MDLIKKTILFIGVLLLTTSVAALVTYSNGGGPIDFGEDVVVSTNIYAGGCTNSGGSGAIYTAYFFDEKPATAWGYRWWYGGGWGPFSKSVHLHGGISLTLKTKMEAGNYGFAEIYHGATNLNSSYYKQEDLLFRTDCSGSVQVNETEYINRGGLNNYTKITTVPAVICYNPPYWEEMYCENIDRDKIQDMIDNYADCEMTKHFDLKFNDGTKVESGRWTCTPKNSYYFTNSYNGKKIPYNTSTQMILFNNYATCKDEVLRIKYPSFSIYTNKDTVTIENEYIIKTDPNKTEYDIDEVIVYPGVDVTDKCLSKNDEFTIKVSQTEGNLVVANRNVFFSPTTLSMRGKWTNDYLYKLPSAIAFPSEGKYKIQVSSDKGCKAETNIVVTATCNQNSIAQSNGTVISGGCAICQNNKWTFRPAGTTCNDGQSCTINDQCNSSGTCSGSPATELTQTSECSGANACCTSTNAGSSAFACFPRTSCDSVRAELPTVGQLTPNVAGLNETVTWKADARDDDTLVSSEIKFENASNTAAYDQTLTGTLTSKPSTGTPQKPNGYTISTDHAIPTPGQYYGWAQATDSEGNLGIGPKTLITIGDTEIDVCNNQANFSNPTGCAAPNTCCNNTCMSNAQAQAACGGGPGGNNPCSNITGPQKVDGCNASNEVCCSGACVNIEGSPGNCQNDLTCGVGKAFYGNDPAGTTCTIGGETSNFQCPPGWTLTEQCDYICDASGNCQDCDPTCRLTITDVSQGASQGTVYIEEVLTED